MSLQVMISVWIDDDFIAEIESGAESAFNWTVESITSWGATIAGEGVHEGEREGPVFLGNDGGATSRHVGHWKSF